MAAPAMSWSREYIVGPTGTTPARMEAPVTPVATTIATTTAPTYNAPSGGASIFGMTLPSNTTITDYGFRENFAAAQDLSGEPYIGWGMHQYGYPWPGGPADQMDTFANGGASIIWFDGAGNWSEFYFFGSEFPNVSEAFGGWAGYGLPGFNVDAGQFVLERSRTPDASSGTLDWTDIEGFEVVFRKTTSNAFSGRFNVGCFFLFDKPEFTAGEAANPLDFDYIWTQLTAENSQYEQEAVFYNTRDTQSKGIFEGGTGQIYEMWYTVKIGDGTTATYFRDTGTTIAAYPLAHIDRATLPRLLLEDTDRGIEINTTATCDVEFDTTIFSAADAPGGECHISVEGNTSGSVSFLTCQFFRQEYVTLAHATATNCLFDDCEQVEIDANTTMTGAILRNTASTGKGLYIQSAAGDYSDIDIEFKASNSGDDITINPPATGTWDLTGITVESGHTLAIRNEHATRAITVEIPAGTSYSTSTAGGTVTVVSPAVAFTINTNETGCDIRMFTTATQTQLAGTASGNTLEYEHSSETIDYTVQKAGFLPQRVTGKVLSGTEAITVNLVADPVYDSGHGLTYTTDASWSRTNNELTVPTFGPTVREIYSLLIDSFISESALRNTAFNIQMNGPNSMFLIEDAEGASDASIENMTDGGVRYVTSADVTAAEWCGIQSIDGGAATGLTAEYQQQDGSGTTDARASGQIDELIKTYGDATHGNFDYRGHLVLKYQVNGYNEVRVDVLDTYGITALEPTLYVVAMAPTALNAATGDPAISITITDHGATPVSWQTKDWSITVTDSATPSSAEEILREINYNLAQDATYQGKDPFNWPQMIVEEGADIATSRGITEGAQSSTLKGIRVVENDGSTPHSGFSRMQADDGSYYTPPATYSLTIGNLVAGSQVIVYDSGTQTILDSTASSGTSFVYSGTYTADQTVDYTVIQAGYFPIRVTGVTLSDSAVVQAVNMIEDRAYQASSGLTYGTTATVDTVLSQVAVTVATTVQNWWSFMIESWRDQAALRNVEFPFSTNGPNSFSLNDGWEWDGTSSINNLSRDGFRYVDSGGTVTASWCAVLSQGEATGMQAEYQQQDGSGTTDTLTTGVVDQCIQIYGDASHGNFDYTGHLVFKIQENGYEQARADVVDTYGTLEDQFYVIALAPAAIAGFTLGDPSATGLTITDHGATPVTWQTKDFSITVEDTGANSGATINRWINYALSLDATFQGKDPFNWPEMVIDNGAAYETERGPVEGDVGAALKGVRVIRGGSAHPDFTRFQADDGTYYTVPVTAGVSAPNLTAGRIQLYNVTTATEVENTTVTTGYSRNWTDGTDFTAGDVIRLRWVAADSLPITMNGVALASGTVTFLDTPVDDDVYDGYAIDGSTVTEYSADYPNVQVDINDPDNVFYIDRFYAWYKYNLTTSSGIDEFWGAVEAVNASNILIHNATVDIFFDNTKTVSARQGDNILISRDDGVYPQVTVTSGGGGLGFYYTGVGYTVETGVSGLTAEESAKLNAASTFDPENDNVEGSETYQDSLRLMRAALVGESAVVGDTVTFRDAADSKDRITATTDENGQRTAVTADAT